LLPLDDPDYILPYETGTPEFFRQLAGELDLRDAAGSCSPPERSGEVGEGTGGAGEARAREPERGRQHRGQHGPS